MFAVERYEVEEREGPNICFDMGVRVLLAHFHSTPSKQDISMIQDFRIQ